MSFAKNLSLGKKIGGSFGAVLAIFMVVGAVSLWNVSTVKESNRELVEETLPVGWISNDIMLSFSQAMYAIRGYAFTENDTMLEQGKVSISETLRNLQNADELVKKYPKLADFGAKAQKATASIKVYEDMVEKSRLATEETRAARARQDAAVKDFQSDFFEFLGLQEEKLDAAIAAKDTEDASRIRKLISTANKVTEDVNNVRILTWRAQASRDLSKLKDAAGKFERIFANAATVKELVLSKEGKDKLEKVISALQNFKDGIQTVDQKLDQREELNASRVKIATETIKELEAVVKTGTEEVKADSASVTAKLASTAATTSFGVLIALVCGVFLAVMVTRAIMKPVLAVQELITAVAGGDMTRSIDVESNDEVGMMARCVNDMGANLRTVLSEVRTSTMQVNQGAGEISDASQSLSQGATEQAASLEEITSSITEVAAQTKTNADNATQANHLAVQARDAAEKGSEQMKGMVVAMNDINDSSQQIAKIIKVIDDIAFQTNLLALNAAVEAARAGRHGKGFAVVADEVRNLAGRSAKAAKETAELIESSGHKVENGLSVATETSESFKDILSNAVKVADLVGEIAAASNEQAQAVTQVNQGLTQIDQVTQQNTANAEETAAAAEELSGQAVQLRELVSRFKLGNEEAGVKAPVHKAPVIKKTAPKNGWGYATPVNGNGTTGHKKTAIIDLSEHAVLDSNEFGRF